MLFPNKGALREGDPLSPYLFILGAKVLSRMLIKAEEGGIIHGARVAHARTSYHTPFFFFWQTIAFFFVELFLVKLEPLRIFLNITRRERQWILTNLWHILARALVACEVESSLEFLVSNSWMTMKNIWKTLFSSIEIKQIAFNPLYLR